jgi:hypothetical protein
MQVRMYSRARTQKPVLSSQVSWSFSLGLVNYTPSSRIAARSECIRDALPRDRGKWHARLCIFGPVADPEIETFGLTGRQGGADVLPMELQNDDVVDIVVQTNSFLL